MYQSFSYGPCRVVQCTEEKHRNEKDVDMVELIMTVDFWYSHSNPLKREIEESNLLGFVAPAEIVNGRSAMFFIVVGILTELFTGESMPSQVATMLQTFGIIGLDN